jgi:imidazolonepropionase-like amidohydrolase
MSRNLNNAAFALLGFTCIVAGCNVTAKTVPDSKGLIIKNVTLIDGNGGAPVEGIDLLIRGDTIAEIGRNIQAAGITVLDATGKTIMPALISAHVHVGTLKGTKSQIENYTRENILAQLAKYADYGVLNVLAMGTDRPALFMRGLYDSLKSGQLPGARMYTAGYGFGVPGGAPAPGGTMNLLFRPTGEEQVPAEIDSLLRMHPNVAKLWVDDFGGQYKKMDTAVYKAIIKAAHQRNLRVAAHCWYLGYYCS